MACRGFSFNNTKTHLGFLGKTQSYYKLKVTHLGFFTRILNFFKWIENPLGFFTKNCKCWSFWKNHHGILRKNKNIRRVPFHIFQVMTMVSSFHSQIQSSHFKFKYRDIQKMTWNFFYKKATKVYQNPSQFFHGHSQRILSLKRISKTHLW